MSASIRRGISRAVVTSMIAICPAAWGEDVNFIGTANFSALNNGGDGVGLWTDAAGYADFCSSLVGTLVPECPMHVLERMGEELAKKAGDDVASAVGPGRFRCWSIGRLLR